MALDPTTFKITDRDGDKLRVQLGLQSAVFSATDCDTGEMVQVAVRPAELARLITTLQTIQGELS